MLNFFRMSMRQLRVRVDSVVYAAVGLFFVSMAAVYTLAGYFDQVRSTSFIISVAFSKEPSRSVAAFFFPLVAFFSALIFTARFLGGYEAHNKITRKPSVFFRYLFLPLSLASCVGMVGTSAVSLDHSKLIHSFFALSMFALGLLALLIATIDDYRRFGGLKLIVLLRAVVLSVAIISFGGMLFGIFVIKNRLVIGTSEVIMAFLVFMYLVSFAHDYKGRYIVISLGSAPAQTELLV